MQDDAQAQNLVTGAQSRHIRGDPIRQVCAHVNGASGDGRIVIEFGYRSSAVVMGVSGFVGIGKRCS